MLESTRLSVSRTGSSRVDAVGGCEDDDSRRIQRIGRRQATAESSGEDGRRVLVLHRCSDLLRHCSLPASSCFHHAAPQRTSTDSPCSTRRRATHPANAPRRALRPSLSQQLSQSSTGIRTSSPQLSRRGSIVFGHRSTPSSQPPAHPAYAAPPLHSPLRPSFSSRRLAQASRASPARQSYDAGPSFLSPLIPTDAFAQNATRPAAPLSDLQASRPLLSPRIAASGTQVGNGLVRTRG